MNDDKNLPDHLEDVPERPIDSDRVLSDDELLAGGLQPVKAYVRTRAGKAAERQQRYREKKEAEGFKQTNVQVPDEHQETIREIARRLREGEPLEGVSVPKPEQKPEEKPVPVDQVKPDAPEKPAPISDEAPLTEADKRLLAVVRSGGFRSRLVRLLAGV